MKSMEYWHYTYEELKELAPKSIAVLPIGAVEQHGRHLPVGTDSLIATEFVRRLQNALGEEEYPALFLPLMPFGKSNEHINFPGTVFLNAETLLAVLKQIGASCKRAGFQKLVILNCHGGNHELIDMATREIRIESGLKTFAVHPLLKILPKDISRFHLSERERRLGIHAGRIETSIIMRIDQGLVREDRMQPDYPEQFEDCRYLDFSEIIPFGWTTDDVSKTGAIGDPTGSNAQDGEAWLSETLTVLREAFWEILRYGENKGESNHE